MKKGDLLIQGSTLIGLYCRPSMEKGIVVFARLVVDTTLHKEKTEYIQ